MAFCFRPLNGESFSKQGQVFNATKDHGTKGFRPLNGESFSKQMTMKHIKYTSQSFRPLNGESFSKLWWSEVGVGYFQRREGFRPLNGESFSKLDISDSNVNSIVSVP